MATVVKVRRVVNPRKRRAKAKRKRNSRRRLTAKQIKFFGTKAQKAALKRRRKPVSKKRAAPKRRKVVRVARKRNSRRRVKRARSNPALVVTLGAVNPKRRKKSMARRRKKSNPRRRSRRNATRVVVMAPRRNKRRTARRVNPHRRRSYRRRNPQLMGSSVSTTAMAKAVAGGLVGVAAAKFIPTMIPAQFVGSNIMRTIATGLSAWAASLVAKKVAGPQIGDAVLFGGLMQTGSVALNAFLPGVAKTLGISGFGELVDGRFVVPENPLRGIPAAPAAVNANVTMSGIGRAFRPAF